MSSFDTTEPPGTRKIILASAGGILGRAFEGWKEECWRSVPEWRLTLKAERHYRFSLCRRMLSTWQRVVAEQRQAKMQYPPPVMVKAQSPQAANVQRETQQACIKVKGTQAEAVMRLQHDKNLALLQRYLRLWREQTHERQREGMERARRHHESKLLSRVLTALKVYQQISIQEREQLHRQQEVHQVEKALWHWCLSLEAKVFYAWRVWVAQQRGQREYQARAASDSMKHTAEDNMPDKEKMSWAAAETDKTSAEEARRHHQYKLLSCTLTAWREDHHLALKKKMMRQQQKQLLELKMYQRYFDMWQTKYRRQVAQHEKALWHWCLTLEGKVLRAWSLWVVEQRCQRVCEPLQAPADEQLREEDMAHTSVCEAHVVALTSSDQEKKSSHLQTLVRRCAQQWKRRALHKQHRQQDVRSLPPSFSTGSERAEGSGSAEQSSNHNVVDELWSTTSRTNITTQQHTGPQPSDNALHSGSEMACWVGPQTLSHSLLCDASLHGYEEKPLLLPPSAFMTASRSPVSSGAITAPKCLTDTPFIVPREEGSSRLHPDMTVHQQIRAAQAEIGLRLWEDAEYQLMVMEELLRIQVCMEDFQKDRELLVTLKDSRRLFQTWLEMTEEGENMEKHSVCAGMNELERHIKSLSAKMDRQRLDRLRLSQLLDDLWNLPTSLSGA